MPYKWTKLTHPTMYPVKEDGKTVIPVGADGVEVAYSQSSKPLLDNHRRPTGKMQNVYRWNGLVFNA